jgi:hypothetical protein
MIAPEQRRSRHREPAPAAVFRTICVRCRRAWLALRARLQGCRSDLRRVRAPRVVEGRMMASNLTEREILRRLQRLIELMAIAEGDASYENRRRLFEFVGRDELLVGTLKRIESYDASAPDSCLADPPWRSRGLN